SCVRPPHPEKRRRCGIHPACAAGGGGRVQAFLAGAAQHLLRAIRSVPIVCSISSAYTWLRIAQHGRIYIWAFPKNILDVPTSFASAAPVPLHDNDHGCVRSIVGASVRGYFCVDEGYEIDSTAIDPHG